MYAQYPTLDACLAFCTSLPACVGVDFDMTATPSAGCWVHTSANDFANVYLAPMVTQYRINRTCSSSIAPNGQRRDYLV